MYKGKELKPDSNAKNRKVDSLIIKQRCYELIVKGYSNKNRNKILMEEFGIAENTVKNYCHALYTELNQDYKEQIENIRQILVLDLFEIKNNECKTVWEKFKAIEMIAKYTGLDRETSDETHVNPTGNNFIIKQYNLNEPKNNDKNG